MTTLRIIIDKLTSVLAWIRKNQVIKLNDFSGIVKINLGCGLTVGPGWVNLDGSLNALVAHFPRIIKKSIFRFSGSSNYYSLEQYLNILETNRFVFHDLSYSLPFENAKIDYCYTSHLLEHLTKHQGEHLLREIFRILKPCGVVRVVIPDLQFALGLYEKGQKSRMLEDFFFVESCGSHFARHKYMYDFQLIKDVLERCGFIEVTRFEYKQGNVPDIEMLDNQPEVSLYLEAQKP